MRLGSRNANMISSNNNWICYVLILYTILCCVLGLCMRTLHRRWTMQIINMRCECIWNGKRNFLPKWENPNCHWFFRHFTVYRVSTLASAYNNNVNTFKLCPCVCTVQLVASFYWALWWLMIHSLGRGMPWRAKTHPHLFRASCAQTWIAQFAFAVRLRHAQRLQTIIMRRIMAFFCSNDNTESKHNQNKRPNQLTCTCTRAHGRTRRRPTTDDADCDDDDDEEE